MQDFPTHRNVVTASRRIAGQVKRTPLLKAEVDGNVIWLKCECLQTGGAFKLRGATNRLLELSERERATGVVAFSSGNHAQGVAIAARRLGIAATIVMPSDAPTLKVEGTRREGAEIVFYDRASESREAIATAIADERGAVVVPSFDDPRIVAGQGTVGLEILEQCAEEGAPAPAALAAPVGGGGLLAGIALACPEAAIFGAEPAGWDDMRESLLQGEIVPVGDDPPPTACDALQTQRVSPITFGILASRSVTIAAVDEQEVASAMSWANDRHGLVVEPGGAAALAALLAGKLPLIEGMVVVLSGGNVDDETFRRLIARG